MDLSKISAWQNEYDPMTPLNISKRDVYRLADECAKKFEYSPADDLFKFISDFNGDVHFLDVLEHSDIHGTIFVHEKGAEQTAFDIILPSFTGPLRDRFTIAHEFGHYVLHYLLKQEEQAAGCMATRRDGDKALIPRLEWEANWFASGFLMPTSELKRLAADLDKKDSTDLTTVELGGRFDVSASAAEYRLAYHTDSKL